MLKCTVVTPERAILDEDAERVVVPAHDGEIGILPGHARLLAKLGVGVLRVTSGGKTRELFVEGGFVQVAADKVTVLTEAASEVADVDVAAADKLVDELRGKGRGEEFADAKHRSLVMRRVQSHSRRT
ncbi:MAG: ATP synthase F1 subunit epsilon [bacterium]